MSETVDIYEQLAVWSQVVGSIAFIITLVYVFKRFLVPAVIASQEQKNAELSEAERRRDASKEELAAVRRELDGLEEEVKNIRVRAAVDARKERERILADEAAEGERLLRNAEKELDRGRVAAREAFRSRILEKALSLARHSAGERIDANRDRELVGGVMDAIGHGEALHA